MADRTKIVPGSADGDFFVDTTCMGCGACRDIAPATFSQDGKYYKVSQQPRNEDEIAAALQALVCCPKGSIGTSSTHHGKLQETIESFPKKVRDNVYFCGFNTDRSAGGKSYFIVHESGNWMIDSPRFTPRLVQWLYDNGGLKYIFLTHRDDVGEQFEFAWEFGAKRIMHEADIEAEPNTEIVITGVEPIILEKDFTVIPTPGHTPGHSMLLYKKEFLFTGDMLTANTRFGKGLEISDPFYCWWSWDEQTKSIERLLKHDFTKTLPSHGAAYTAANVAAMRVQIESVLNQCKTEPNPEPTNPRRIAFFELIADYAGSIGQPEWSKIMHQRAQHLREISLTRTA